MDVAEQLLYAVHPLVRGYGGQPLHLTGELVAKPPLEGVLDPQLHVDAQREHGHRRGHQERDGDPGAQ